MLLYANVFSDKEEEEFGTATSGAHFYQDTDPENDENKVLKVLTRNTIYNLPSKTNISGNRIAHTPTCCEFEMRYRFDTVPWVFWPKYFTLNFCAKNDIPVFSISFATVDHRPEGGGPARKICMRLDDSHKIESTMMISDRWYDIRIEYYPNPKAQSNGRVKIYVALSEEDRRLVYDGIYDGKSDEITRAVIVHSATKIKGTQYFDDLSFTLTDRKYSPLSEPATPKEKKVIYGFEDGIPSSRSFNIQMQLKKGDERATFDPSAWRSAGATSIFKSNRNFYEITLVVSGNGRFVTDLGESPFAPGCIFITSPGHNHTIMADEGYKVISVMGHFEKLAFIDDYASLSDNIYNEGKKLAELILYNRFGNEDYLEALCDAYIKYIIVNMERTPKNTTAAIYKIISKMEKSFGQNDLSVGALLDDSGYARDYIRAEFLAVTKVTPKKYLNDIRMKNAKAMIDLYGDEMSIGEIAERCGIIDQSVFSRIFKKHFGISPTDYKIRSK